MNNRIENPVFTTIIGLAACGKTNKAHTLARLINQSAPHQHGIPRACAMSAGEVVKAMAENIYFSGIEPQAVNKDVLSNAFLELDTKEENGIVHIMSRDNRVVSNTENGKQATRYMTQSTVFREGVLYHTQQTILALFKNHQVVIADGRWNLTEVIKPSNEIQTVHFLVTASEGERAEILADEHPNMLGQEIGLRITYLRHERDLPDLKNNTYPLLPENGIIARRSLFPSDQAYFKKMEEKVYEAGRGELDTSLGHRYLLPD